jgi:hypothetical protein
MDRQSRYARPEMAVGGVLGATTGGLLGGLDLIGAWVFWAVAILGIYLVAFSWPDASNKCELAGALFRALAGVVVGALGLALVFGSVTGIFFAVMPPSPFLHGRPFGPLAQHRAVPRGGGRSGYRDRPRGVGV